ncbi:MAG TPA: GvpL/GvpF family gas vesicle protein [Armatimonadota bacterium]|nr:GvpL/GvpF family gas vesicle protein [Armatimonadota bacterium]
MDVEGKCILCIVEAGPLADVRESGIYTIPYRDIAAVVRDVPVPAPQPTRQDLVSHLRTIEQIMTTKTVIPVGFGNTAGSEQEVSDGLLAARYDEWQALLAHLAGKVELGLKVMWKEMTAVLAEIVAAREDIRALRDKLARRPQAGAYQGRIEVGRLVAEALEVGKVQEGAAILERLAPFAAETRGGKLLGESMILNAAFLVERRREPEFDGAVSRLAEDCGERLLLKYVGPTPPFNFVSV